MAAGNDGSIDPALAATAPLALPTAAAELDAWLGWLDAVRTVSIMVLRPMQDRDLERLVTVPEDADADAEGGPRTVKRALAELLYLQGVARGDPGLRLRQLGPVGQRQRQVAVQAVQGKRERGQHAGVGLDGHAVEGRKRPVRCATRRHERPGQQASHQQPVQQRHQIHRFSQKRTADRLHQPGVFGEPGADLLGRVRRDRNPTVLADPDVVGRVLLAEGIGRLEIGDVPGRATFVRVRTGGVDRRQPLRDETRGARRVLWLDLHTGLAPRLDAGLSALLDDLEQRDLLRSTVVICGGEFGRTPMNEERNGSKYLGRDHHPRCFTMWMAGGGIKGGVSLGKTDELGFHPVEDPIHVAAILITGVARLEGDLSAEQKQVLLTQFEQKFSLSPQAAKELMTAATHLLGAPQVIETQLNGLADRHKNTFSGEQAESLVEMLCHVASVDGDMSATQHEFVNSLRSRLTVPQPEGTWA